MNIQERHSSNFVENKLIEPLYMSSAPFLESVLYSILNYPVILYGY